MRVMDTKAHVIFVELFL